MARRIEFFQSLIDELADRGRSLCALTRPQYRTSGPYTTSFGSVRTRRRNVVQESCHLGPCAVWQMEHAGLK